MTTIAKKPATVATVRASKTPSSGLQDDAFNNPPTNPVKNAFAPSNLDGTGGRYG